MKFLMESDSDKTEDMLYKLGWLFLIFGCVGYHLYRYVLIPLLPDIPCVFLQVTGIYCPGCGGTRAVDALLRGQLIQSFLYHPLVLYTVVIFGGFMLTNTLERLHVPHIKGWRYHAWHFYGALIVLGVNWVVKNLLLFDKIFILS